MRNLGSCHRQPSGIAPTKMLKGTAMRFAIALTLGLWLFAASTAQAQQTFALFCRGQYSYVVHPDGNFQISLNKGQLAAGGSGANLTQGMCAWSDRPIAGDEPNVLIFQYSITVGTSFAVCAQNTNCTFMVRAYNDKEGRFRVKQSRLWIWNR